MKINVWSSSQYSPVACNSSDVSNASNDICEPDNKLIKKLIARVGIVNQKPGLARILLFYWNLGDYYLLFDSEHNFIKRGT